MKSGLIKGTGFRDTWISTWLAPIVVGISTPTGLAVRTAEAAGITLAGVARDDGFEVFTHPERITKEPTVPGSFQQPNRQSKRNRRAA
jgi:hypothetical protein